ncbi:hypothetical protein M9Y10_008820 [Tritrichomonas musculus]|uniref:Uncharacterized protein n=1 Tax=Tritrichomonas musculus TaxID=1915356 RepID=A0ABR2J118_9EUKA
MFIPAQTQLMSLTLTLLLKLFMMLFQNYQQRVMIMFYYDNHGGPGVLGTPNLLRDIKAAELAESFTKAADSNLYKQYLFIIEACYSG